MSQYYFCMELVFAIWNDIFLSTLEDKNDREQVPYQVCKRNILFLQMRLHIAFQMVTEEINVAREFVEETGVKYH